MTNELKINDTIPTFVLPLSDDTLLDSKELKKKLYIIYFYPKDNTPGCTNEAKDFSSNIEKFKKNSFGLCILDVMLPFKDGFTLAKEIRDLNKDVPLFFLTAKTLKDDVLKGYKLGADDYLTKPFDSDILLLKIKSIFKRKKISSSENNVKFMYQFADFNFNSKFWINNIFNT